MLQIVVLLAFVAVAYGFPFPEDVRERVPVKDDVVKHVVPMKFDGIKEDDVKKDLKDSASFGYAYYRPYIYNLPVRTYIPHGYNYNYIYHTPSYRYWI